MKRAKGNREEDGGGEGRKRERGHIKYSGMKLAQV